ncbi:SLOG family protein [Terasakiella sp. SH-1]|uniref:SLOG family protein n=1 Tax=Terasakiella sp. SH-1 TaxID=2560057 RepID=UPI001073765F|nr:SLOG family protein [Terasakiella sp. SH-1]
MKTIIAGSRQIEDKEALAKTISDSGFEISEIVSGTCRGVDMMGEEWGGNHDVPVKRFPADWLTHGRLAGELRNRDMAKYADQLILLWDGKSPGASCMLREANMAGITVHTQIYGVDMAALQETEKAIMDYYVAGKGRLINNRGHWDWEINHDDAPRITQEAVNELIRQGLMEEEQVTILKVCG